VLAGQSPIGEVLACPSAVALDAVAVCLVDVDDDTRRARLAARDAGRWDTAAINDSVAWAAWHREHAADPRRRPEVVTTAGWAAMRWERWSAWTAGDPRWSVPVIDTTGEAPQSSARRLDEWVASVRRARAAGELELTRGWEQR
jgi:hypothetical protein